MNYFLKKSILSSLSKVGFLDFMRYKNRQNITVLMIHGVMAEHENVSWVPLRPQLQIDELQHILKILSEYYQFITIDQCADILEGKVAPINHALLITFDDGYRNNIDYALPICERFGIKPIIFVATKHIYSGLPFWFDRLDYALQQIMGTTITLEYKGKSYYFDATSRQALKASYKKFRDNCKRLFTDDIEMNRLFDALSQMLEERSGKALSDICLEDDWSAIATWPQLRTAVKNGRLDVGSHTVNHWRIDRLSKKHVLSQLQQSKKSIEQELSIQCDYFCYPNGDYNNSVIKLLEKSGYRAAFSTDVGKCNLKDNLMTLKRFSFPAHRTKNEILYLLNR